jgi:hypothetical protein
MLVRRNILLISGLGRDTGKTLLATKVIEKFSLLGVTAIKVSPHFHSSQEQPLFLGISNFFEVYEEKNPTGQKDSSRMLKAGAKKVFYIQCTDKTLERVLSIMIMHLDKDIPIICESGALSKYIIPGIHVLMTPILRKNIGERIAPVHDKKMPIGSPNITLNLSNYNTFIKKIKFENGNWYLQ